MNGWTKWVAGLLFTVLFTASTTLIANVIANDKASRERDTKLTADLSEHVIRAEEKMYGYVMEQQVTNGEILKSLAVMQNDLKHIRSNGTH